MPISILERAGKYCFSNIKNLAIILFLIYSIDVLNILSANFRDTALIYIFSILVLILTLITTGYGLVVTRDVIHGGKELPPVFIKDSIGFGIKSTIITSVYIGIQIIILTYIAIFFHFPRFELEELFLNIEGTGNLLFAHDLASTILFMILSAIVLYASVFFMEISLAILADEGHLRKTLNIIHIKECIDKIGWRHYCADYTKIIISIVILTYLKYGIEYFHLIDDFADLLFGFLIFTIEYLGIAWTYKEYKEKTRLENSIEISIE